MEETKIVKTSYSALDTFKQCPLKYKFQAIDRIKAPKTKEAVFGDRIHKTLQFLHSKEFSPASPAGGPTLDEMLNYFKEIWNSDVFQDEQEDMIYFSEAIKILKHYYEHYLLIKDKLTVLGTETRFEVLLENPQSKNEKCLLAGIVDRIDKTKTGIEIVDYKTTKKLPSQEDVNNSMQMSLYCLGIINRWPQFAKSGIENIKLTFYYLKHQESISTFRTKQQLDHIQTQIWNQLKQIETSKFEPMPSALCDWCGYKKICPMWKHLYKEQITIDDEQAKKVVDEYFSLKGQNSQNTKKLKELQGVIEIYLNREKIERVFGSSGYITRLIQVRKGNYDIKKLEEIIKILPQPIQEQLHQAKTADKQYKIIKTSAKRIPNP
ncbi:PD-(D/E)XK nuclease family protein [Patescibacteria group bacterium]|nr:PD-(D/E)XK nuclease family protein [Patescibacteria group bacterium]MBU4458749.1 PD-(D/E)XK nuclease family protein [Patescibacteria group bacterium]MCG2696050.1 PD-(D/E)XK nuclease family protein [Candidatus Portnoybacteria bacterium]